jgi:repressor of nif and glnA expression
MGIADGIKDIKNLRPGPKDKVTMMLEKIAEDHGELEAQQVALALEDDKIQATSLASYLVEQGYAINGKAIRYYRKRLQGRI